MSPEDAAKALPVVGMVGTVGFFLPGVDKSWSAEPYDDDYRRRLRSGELVYLSWAALLGMLAAYAYRTLVPLYLCLGFAGSVLAIHEYALHYGGSE